MKRTKHTQNSAGGEVRRGRAQTNVFVGGEGVLSGRPRLGNKVKNPDALFLFFKG